MDPPLHSRMFTGRSARNPTPAAAAASNEGKAGTTIPENELFPGQEHLVRLVVTQSLPMLFRDAPGFQNFINVLNPLFPKISSAVLRKAAMAYYAKGRESLLPVLRDLNSRVSLTCSLWSDPECQMLDGLIYLYLNCHWIDENWKKQNRVLGFMQLDYPLDSENVSASIMAVVSKWEIEGKVFSILFGNDMRNDAVAALSELQVSLNPMFDGQLSQGKCVYHVVNLCMEHGFSKISSLLDKVRYVVEIVDYRGLEQVRGLCRKSGLNYKRILSDFPSLVYTTYEMLDAFVAYRDVLTKFCSLDLAAGEYHGTPLSEDEWSFASSMRSFLGRFKAAFDLLCSVYVPTSNLVIPLVFTLSEAFAQYRDDMQVGQICAEMEAKFSAYWSDGFPMVYCLATVLDPRYKLAGLFKLLDGYHGNMNASIGDMKDEIKTLFYKMYEAYFQQYFPPPITEEDLILPGCCNNCSNSGGTESAVRLVHGTKKDDGKEGSDYSVSYVELDYYLSSNDLSSLRAEDIDKLAIFDVLKWWKRNQVKYPVLATMALDLLAPLPSAKVPEGTFDFHASDINEKRREIGPRTAEMSVCLKDWFQAEAREQKLLVDERERDDDGDDEEEEEEYDDDDEEEEEEDYDDEEEEEEDEEEE